MWETLRACMIGDSDGFVSPTRSLRDQIRHIWNGIHGRHISVRMEFDSLLPFGHEVLPNVFRLDFDHITRTHDQLMLVLIHLNTALDFNPHAFFDHIKHGLLLRLTSPFLDDKRAAVVCHLDFQHMAFLTGRTVLKDLMLRRKNVAFKDDIRLLSHDILHLEHGIRRLNFPAQCKVIRGCNRFF